MRYQSCNAASKELPSQCGLSFIFQARKRTLRYLMRSSMHWLCGNDPLPQFGNHSYGLQYEPHVCVMINTFPSKTRKPSIGSSDLV